MARKKGKGNQAAAKSPAQETSPSAHPQPNLDPPFSASRLKGKAKERGQKAAANEKANAKATEGAPPLIPSDPMMPSPKKSKKPQKKGPKAKKVANVFSKSSLQERLPLPDPLPIPRARPAQTTSGRKPLKPLSSLALNMMQKAKTRAKYGNKESVARLQRVGFDARVTDLNHMGWFKEWSKMAALEGYKAKETASMGPAGPKNSEIFIAPMLLNSEFFVANKDRFDAIALAIETKKKERKRIEISPSNASSSANSCSDEVGLLGSLLCPDIGHSILEAIFATGVNNLKNLGTTSFRIFGLVHEAIRILDCTGGQVVHVAPHSTMFMAVVPEFTIGDFLRARDRDPCGIFAFNFVKPWHEGAVKEEAHTMELLGRIKYELESAPNVGEDTIAVAKHLTFDENFFASRRVVVGQPDEVYKPSVQREGQNIMALAKFLQQHKDHMEHLHFDKVPFLDRRLLAVILRGMPKVTSVSINACPLIHLGDLVPILDVIHAINLSRDKEDKTRILTLDFAPKYERGMPYYQEGLSKNFGLAWDPVRGDVSHAGVYAILLKAFFKARAMGLATLFEKSCALMRYLFKLPTSPLDIPIFMDALYRIGDQVSQNAALHHVEFKKAVFDLLRIVRRGHYSDLDGRAEVLDYFNNEMMKDTKFCLGCGYRMNTAFFYNINHATDVRICFGCELQKMLDAQTHHLRGHRLECLNILFPNHNPEAFNDDAPVSLRNEKNPLLALETTRLHDSTTPTCRMDGKGTIFRIAAKKSRNPYKSDSLVGLPDLGDLVGGESQELWATFQVACQEVDIFRQAVWSLMDQKEQGILCDLEKVNATLAKYAPRGRPDHHLERQLPLTTGHYPGRTHAEAKQEHLELVHDGKMPGLLEEIIGGDEHDKLKACDEERFW